MCQWVWVCAADAANKPETALYRAELPPFLFSLRHAVELHMNKVHIIIIIYSYRKRRNFRCKKISRFMDWAHNF